MIGTNDLVAAGKFYDAILNELGDKRIMDMENFICWGKDMTSTGFCVTKPYNKEAASVWNGTMNAFMVDSIDSVEKLYQKALNLGATDEWAPGYREEFWDKFYPAYVRDLDGNKIAFVFMSE